MQKAKTVDEYIKSSPIESQVKMKELRKLIKATIPEVEEKISYGSPFYSKGGQLGGFVYFKNHISFGLGFDAFDDEIINSLKGKGYVVNRGTFQIKNDQEIPSVEIRKMLENKVKMNVKSRVVKKPRT